LSSEKNKSQRVGGENMKAIKGKELKKNSALKTAKKSAGEMRAAKSAGRSVPQPAYPELFQPIKIGDCEIKNRIVMAPMNTVFSLDNRGFVNEQILAYYAARAKGGTGLIITECVLGTRQAARYPYTSNLHLFDGTHVSGLEEMVETIHAFGAKVFIQLSIGFGRQGHSHDHSPPPAPSAIPYQTDPALMPKGIIKFISEHPWAMDPRIPSMAHSQVPREMTREEITSELREFANSCLLAALVGFDGIELHGPHGYLEHQFLSPRSNQRTDEYGGSLENRMRFVVEIYEEAKKVIGKSIPIGIRLSGDEHMPNGIHHDELKLVVKRMGELGVDYVHLSDGSYEALKYFFPDEDNLHLVEEAAGFKANLPARVPVISVSLHDPANSSRAIREGKIDMVSLGRQMLCDPDYANKVMAGQKYRKCSRCLECLIRTAGGVPVRCKLNRDLGREKYMPEYWRPTRSVGQAIIPAIPQLLPVAP
jgi:2,4-dienoyl-CoA reductase-like NADH-dependent reductase (Old Yellow Enzyme family)